MGGPGAVSLGREERRCLRHDLGQNGGRGAADADAGTAKAIHRRLEGGDGGLARGVEGHTVQHQQMQPRRSRIGQIGRGPGGDGGKKLGTILDAAGQRAGHVETRAQRHHARHRHLPRRRLEAHQPVPRRRQPDRAAGIRADTGRSQPERHRNGRTGARPARCQRRIERIGRGGRDRVQTQPAEGQFGHMGLAEAHEPGLIGIGQHHRIAIRHPALQQRRSGLGRGAGTVDIVLPAERDTVQQPAPQPGTGAVMGGDGLGPGALRGQPGEDPVAFGMARDRLQTGIGQIDRRDQPRQNRPPLFACRAGQPIHARDPPCFPAKLIAAARPVYRFCRMDAAPGRA